MQMSGEQRIPAPRAQVWAALNDPEVLKASIPGCESLEPVGDDGFKATVTAKVGPVKAKFTGQVTLSEIDPPNGYTISGEGKGGAAGFARGGAKVHLADDGDGTLMTYEVDANVGGKLAQLGSRLIDGTARKLADEFFAKFSELAAQHPADATATPGSPSGPAPSPEPPAAPAAAEPGIETMRDTSQSPPAPAVPPRDRPADAPPPAAARAPAASAPGGAMETAPSTVEPPRPTAAEAAAPIPEPPAEPGQPAPSPKPIAAGAAAEATRRRVEQPMPSSSTGLPTWVWGVGVIVLIAIGIYLFAF